MVKGKSFKDDLFLESYERNSGFKKYLGVKKIKKLMKKKAEKGKYNLKLSEKQIRMKDVRQLKEEGFDIEYKQANGFLRLLGVGPRYVISWFKEGVDIGLEVIKGNPTGVIRESVDMLSKISDDIIELQKDLKKE